MMALGAKALMKSSDTSFGWISQYTEASRTRRAMSCVTWEPKSRMRTLSCCMAGLSGRLGGGRLAAEEAQRDEHGQRLERGTGEKGQTDEQIARRAVRHPAQQLQRDDGRAHRHQAVQRRNGAHGLALMGCIGGVGNDALHRRSRHATEQVGADHDIHHPAFAREAETEIGQGARAHAGDGQTLGTEPLEQRTQQHALADDGDDAHRQQRPADLPRPPAELELGVEHPAGVQHELGQRAEGQHQHQRPDVIHPVQTLQRRDRIELAQFQRPAPLDRQRLRQHEEAVQPVHHRQAARDIEGQPHIDVPQQAADHGAEHETQAEHRTQLAEALGPVLRCGDVGHIGVGDGNIGLHRAGEQPHHHQHPQCRRRGGDEEAQRQPGKADQQHRAAAEAVRQRTQHRRAEEVGHAEGQRQHQETQCLLVVALGEQADDVWQHRHDQADADHVDQHRNHDEAHTGGALAGGGVGHAGGLKTKTGRLAFAPSALLALTRCGSWALPS
mmetsp:Transcript_26318/g.62508  ORF Transcript_26318/g.62508 Transcript_26318/m.62508 type:complete len:499 (-) Transcript_26318:2047-3543(-)